MKGRPGALASCYHVRPAGRSCESRIDFHSAYLRYVRWASPENPMWKFLYKTPTAGLKDLQRKVAMVFAIGTLDFAKEAS